MCLELYQKGAITPIHPATYFDAIDVTKAFAHLGGGSHIGKAVVRMPSDPSEITDISTASSLGFDENSTYIITGGLGGLGQVLLMWMMERGARHFILISPTAGLKNSHVELMKKMEAQGCSLEAVAGEVQNKDDVERAVAAASKPIRGVIHLAMILRVSDPPSMTLSLFFPVTVLTIEVGRFDSRYEILRLECCYRTQVHWRLESSPVSRGSPP